MKSKRFWIGRYVLVMGALFSILGIVYMLQGQAPAAAAGDALLWSFIAANVFILTRYYHASRGRACALCRDTVDE